MVKFSLEPVLEYKKQVEEKQIRELTEAKNSFNIAYKKLMTLREILKSAKEEFSKKNKKGIKCSERTLYVNYLSNLDDIIEFQQQVVGKEQKNVNDKLKMVIEASKNKKILEELKKKELTDYYKWINKLEAKTMDEIAVQKYSNNKEGE